MSNLITQATNRTVRKVQGASIAATAGGFLGILVAKLLLATPAGTVLLLVPGAEAQIASVVEQIVVALFGAASAGFSGWAGGWFTKERADSFGEFD